MTGAGSRARELLEHPIFPWAALGSVVGLGVAVKPSLALLALGGAAVAAAGLRYPTWLVVLTFVAMLFDRLGVTGQKLGDFPITASKLAVVGTLGLWGLHAGLTAGVRPVRWHRVLGGLLALIGTTAITVAVANTMSEGKFDLYGLAMMLVLVGTTYAILVQAPLAGLYRAMSLAFIGVLAIAVVRSSGGRAAGTMGDPNEWATMVLLITPLLLGGLADDDEPGAPLLRLALLGMAPLAVLRSESRAALAVGVLLTPGVLWAVRKRQTELTVAGITAALAAPFVLDLGTTFARVEKLLTNVQGSSGELDTSFEERSELFRQAVALFREHWFIGVGPGNFSRASGFVSHEWTLRPAHNTYLEIASEQGVVGLAGAAVLAFTVLYTLREGFAAARTGAARHRVAGAALGLAGVGLMAATLGLLTFSMAYLVLGFSLAVCTQAKEADVAR